MNIVLLASALALLCAPVSAAETIDGAHFGPVRIAVPEGPVSGYVVLFSGAQGWSASDESALAPLAEAGALAVGVDTKVYMTHLAALAAAPTAPPCLQFVNDIEGLSKQLQRLHPATHYLLPVLAGQGAGGAMAYTALAQAPVNTFLGAVSLDPAASLQAPALLCGTAPGEMGTFIPGAPANLHGFWTVAFDPAATAAERDTIRKLQTMGVPAKVAGLLRDSSTAALVPLIERHFSPETHVPEAQAPETHGNAGNLPLVELPAAKPSPLLAIILSGDGGWRDLDKTVAEALQKKGVSVLGWDCLRYFWRKKTPGQTAADLSDAVTEYSAKWGTSEVALIGYSFGADILPAVYGRLPPGLRNHVALVSLLGLETKADWEIRVTGWLGAPPSAAATPVAPEIAKIPPGLIQCFYGQDEHDSACTKILAPGSELIETRGGHHFGGDYMALAGDIFASFEKRTAR